MGDGARATGPSSRCTQLLQMLGVSLMPHQLWRLPRLPPPRLPAASSSFSSCRRCRAPRHWRQCFLLPPSQPPPPATPCHPPWRWPPAPCIASIDAWTLDRFTGLLDGRIRENEYSCHVRCAACLLLSFVNGSAPGAAGCTLVHLHGGQVLGGCHALLVEPEPLLHLREIPTRASPAYGPIHM